MLETITIGCPYCGEQVSVVCDCSVDEQEYIEDCFVCCRPMVLRVSVDNTGWPSVIAQPEDDA